MRPGAQCPRRPRAGRAAGGAEESGRHLQPRAQRRRRAGSEGLETVTKAARAAGSGGRGLEAAARGEKRAAPGRPGSQTPRPPGLAAPPGQPILRAREGLRDNGRAVAVLARLATPAKRRARLASRPFPAAARGKAGRRTEPPGGGGKAARGRCRACLEPSGAADSRRVGGQPGSGCTASDGRPAQWGGRGSGLLPRSPGRLLPREGGVLGSSPSCSVHPPSFGFISSCDRPRLRTEGT